MRKSMISVLTVCLLIVGLMAGCSGESKVTAESLLKDVQNSTENLKSMESHTTMDMSMDMPALGGSIDMAMEMTMSTTMDPIANYMQGTITLLGQTMDMENYTIVEGDQILTYTGMLDEWMVQKMPYDEASVNTLDTAEDDLLKNLDSLTLAEQTEDVNGTEAYIISGTIEGKDVENLMGSMESVLGSMTGDGSMDMSGLSVEFRYAISKNDKLPLYMDMSFSGMTVGEGDEQVTISNLSMKMEYTAFDSIDAITVPQDVIDSAVELSDDM